MRLDQLHPHHFGHLLQFLSLEDKKNLRLANKSIYHVINDVDKSVKMAFKKRRLRPAQIKQLANECPSLVGLECTISPPELDGLGEAMIYLHEKHPKIEKIHITFKSKFNIITKTICEHIKVR